MVLRRAATAGIAKIRAGMQACGLACIVAEYEWYECGGPGTGEWVASVVDAKFYNSPPVIVEETPKAEPDDQSYAQQGGVLASLSADGIAEFWPLLESLDTADMRPPLQDLRRTLLRIDLDPATAPVLFATVMWEKPAAEYVLNLAELPPQPRRQRAKLRDDARPTPHELTNAVPSHGRWYDVVGVAAGFVRLSGFPPGALWGEALFVLENVVDAGSL